MDKERRTIVFVDLENCCGGSSSVPLYHQEVHRAVKRLTSAHRSFIVIATGLRALELEPNLLWEWGDARYLIGHGLDGADNELISALVHEPLATRSTHVVLFSGDHIFTEAVRRLTKQGIHTTVAARPGALAQSLKDAACVSAWLPEYGTESVGLISKEQK
jgi:hypothetical protein